MGPLAIGRVGLVDLSSVRFGRSGEEQPLSQSHTSLSVLHSVQCLAGGGTNNWEVEHTGAQKVGLVDLP